MQSKHDAKEKLPRVSCTNSINYSNIHTKVHESKSVSSARHEKPSLFNRLSFAFANDINIDSVIDLLDNNLYVFITCLTVECH